MEFFITLAIILGLFVVPGLINYYVNRFLTPAGANSAPALELIAASLTLTFTILVLDVLMVLVTALIWDQLKEQIAEFVQLGLVDYARNRPIGLTGVLSVYSMSCMAVLTLLGLLRVPSRFLR